MGATVKEGMVALSSLRQTAGSGSPQATSGMDYDDRGNLIAFTALNGGRSCYAYDTSRGLRTKVLEGLFGTTACPASLSNYTPTGSDASQPQRITSLLWHPDWALETARAEPGRRITSVYNGQPDPFQGNTLASCAPAAPLLPDGKPLALLCRQVEQATTDASGAMGFDAPLQVGVPSRETRWTYNQFGRVLTEDGPRSDVNDMTLYEYHLDTTADHTLGDLKRVTNAAGKASLFNKYNKHGQVLESTDGNGVLTVNTYDLRQRLKSSTVGGQTTSYTYDAVGQLKRITQPDASYVGFDYDAAHRQVGVYDHKGNRIEYTLDNAGNKTAQKVKDPAGVLKRQMTQSIDALGRVQQTTGRE
jgi:YD repeat-containing protein